MMSYIDKYCYVVTVFDTTEDDVAGFRLSFDDLTEFAKYLIAYGVFEGMIVLSDDRIANVLYDDDKCYIEQWSLQYDKESGLFKFYNPWKDDPWFSDTSSYDVDVEDIVEYIIHCFDYTTDRIVFNVEPTINVETESPDEDE